MQEPDIYEIRVTKHENGKIRYDMMRGQIWQKEMTKAEIIELCMKCASCLRYE
jgi:hypothetical protein